MLGDPDARHVHVPELVGALDPEEAGPAAAPRGAMALQQALLAHHALSPLAVDLRRRARALASAATMRVPSVGLASRDRDDRPLDRTLRRPPLRRAPRLRRPVDRLAGDLHDARHDRRASAPGHQLARPGDALRHSQPRNASPATSSS
ncbi:MAG: hypothetical protein WKF31_12095 [Thermoleophilaceae bacterium]